MMIKLAVSGARGRMGQRVLELASEDKTFKIKTLLENPNHPEAGREFYGVKVSTELTLLKGCDVLIEFTSPSATIQHVKVCAKLGIKMVIGTTGLTPEEIKVIKKASVKIPIVFSSNMSVGVNILFGIAREVAKKTAGNYAIKIVETHHIHKKDAPSGTAKTIAEIIETAAKEKVDDIQSIREGEIIGDHDVIFESPVDTITIRHHAKTRDIFAAGALVATKFLSKKNKGLFSMEEVLATK